MSEPHIVLQASGIAKSFYQGPNEIVVLQDIELVLRAGERVAIIGRSGSGKSTLLHILAGLDSADAGDIVVSDQNMTTADANARAAIRGAHMGFVYQNHHLLPEFSALENVAMPIRIAGGDRASAVQQAAELLTDVGLEHRLNHLPNALSGGERQRVAVARALAGNPSVVLADEPTGNLDAENAEAVMALITRLSAQRSIAFLVVTHEVALLSAFDRVLDLVDGRLCGHHV